MPSIIASRTLRKARQSRRRSSWKSTWKRFVTAVVPILIMDLHLCLQGGDGFCVCVCELHSERLHEWLIRPSRPWKISERLVRVSASGSSGGPSLWDHGLQEGAAAAFRRGKGHHARSQSTGVPPCTKRHFMTRLRVTNHSSSVDFHQPPKKECVNYKALQQQIKEKKQKAKEDTQPVSREAPLWLVLSILRRHRAVLLTAVGSRCWGTHVSCYIWSIDMIPEEWFSLLRL